MNIGVDIDEVVVEFVRGYLEFYNALKGTSFTYEDMSSYDFWVPLKIAKEDAIDVANQYYDDERFQHISLVKGAKEGVLFLARTHDLYFITSRPRSIKKRTESFFQTHFPSLSLQLYFSGDFWKGSKTKADICEEKEIDLMLEDNLHYALSIAEKGTPVLLIDRPWNQSDSLPEGIKRVYTWDQILEHIS